MGKSLTEKSFPIFVLDDDFEMEMSTLLCPFSSIAGAAVTHQAQ